MSTYRWSHELEEWIDTHGNAVRRWFGGPRDGHVYHALVPLCYTRLDPDATVFGEYIYEPRTVVWHDPSRPPNDDPLREPVSPDYVERVLVCGDITPNEVIASLATFDGELTDGMRRAIASVTGESAPAGED